MPSYLEGFEAMAALRPEFNTEDFVKHESLEYMRELLEYIEGHDKANLYSRACLPANIQVALCGLEQRAIQHVKGDGLLDSLEEWHCHFGIRDNQGSYLESLLATPPDGATCLLFDYQDWSAFVFMLFLFFFVTGGVVDPPPNKKTTHSITLCWCGVQ